MRTMVQPSKTGQEVRAAGCNYFQNFGIATRNIGTLCGKAGQIFETLTR